jgi:GT2 family glycosyltransferase
VSEPRVSVVVPSHDRPLRLRWLLNALEEQTLGVGSFEVIVAHDSSDPETEELLRTHPLADAGVLRHLTFPPGTGPAAKRNAAWREARSPLIAFTDDDCRPPEDWLENVLSAVERAPGAVIQGSTEPDPDELGLTIASGFHRSQRVEPPEPWGQTCNIAYPRALLEKLGGFEEALPVASGEDTDLALRAREAGAPYVGDPAVRMFHMVEPVGLLARMRELWRWRYIPYLVRVHPGLRRELLLGVFWKPSHAWLTLALVGTGVAIGTGFWPALLLWSGWALYSRPSYGRSLRGRVRSLIELPGKAVLDTTELAALVVGSVRHRALFL